MSTFNYLRYFYSIILNKYVLIANFESDTALDIKN